MESLARQVAARVCAVLKDEVKVHLCIELLTKILIQGESVKGEVLVNLRSTSR